MLVCPRIAPVAAERRGWVLVCPEIRPIAAMRRGWVLVCPRIAPVAVAGPAARFPVLCCGRPGAPCLLSHGEQVYKIAGRGSSQSFRLLALILTWPHGEELGAVCPAAMSQPPSFVDKLALGQPRLRNRRLLWTNLPSASPGIATAVIPGRLHPPGQPCLPANRASRSPGLMASSGPGLQIRGPQQDDLKRLYKQSEKKDVRGEECEQVVAKECYEVERRPAHDGRNHAREQDCKHHEDASPDSGAHGLPPFFEVPPRNPSDLASHYNLASHYKASFELLQLVRSS